MDSNLKITNIYLGAKKGKEVNKSDTERSAIVSTIILTCLWPKNLGWLQFLRKIWPLEINIVNQYQENLG